MYLRLSTLKALSSRREIQERTVDGFTPNIVATSTLVNPGVLGLGVFIQLGSRIYVTLYGHTQHF